MHARSNGRQYWENVGWYRKDILLKMPSPFTASGVKHSPSQRALSGADNSPSRNEGHALAGRLPVEAALDAVSGFAPDAMPDAARDDIDDMTDALLDARTRPEHGVILPVDHPWWKRHYPPNGWKCRCKAMSVGPDDLSGGRGLDRGRRAAGRGDFRPTGARRVVGCLDDAVLAFLEGNVGVSPESAAITIEDSEILHLVRTAKKERGNALTTEEVSRLPSLLRSPGAVYWDKGVKGQKREPSLIYFWDAGEHGDGKIIVRVNFKTKMQGEGEKGRRKIYTNAIRSARTGLRAEDMNEENGYVLIDKKP